LLGARRSFSGRVFFGVGFLALVVLSFSEAIGVLLDADYIAV
jgi:hypothetical protein